MPIVNPLAIDRYLARPLASFDFLKEVPHAELWAEARRLGHRFTNDPWHNQLVCFLIGAQQPAFLFFAKMGGGKSATLLELIRFRKHMGHLKAALICVPENVHVSSWEDQIKEHAPDLNYRLLEGSHGERLRSLDRGAELYVTAFKGLESMMTERKSVKKNKHGDAKVNRQLLNKNNAADFASLFNFVGFDELHRIVDPDAVTFEMFSWLSYAADFRYAASGTPIGRHVLPLYSQFKLIDHGDTFGDSIGMFKNVFFTPKEHPFKGIDWKFNADRMPDLHRVIKHRSITYSMKELGDVPQKLLIRLPVRLQGEALVYYNRIVAGLKEARGDYRSLENIFVRMRQCASGFLSMKADDESRLEIEFKDNPKIEALAGFLRTKPNEKILVFHEFRTSAKYIEEMLEGSRIKFASLRGKIKDPREQYQRFLREDSCQIFVLNNQLGSEAINPQYVCRRAVVYESPVDPKKREQLEGRIERRGQKWMSFIHDLIVRGTVEEKILQYNREGRDILAALFSGDASALLTDTGE